MYNIKLYNKQTKENFGILNKKPIKSLRKAQELLYTAQTMLPRNFIRLYITKEGRYAR